MSITDSMYQNLTNEVRIRQGSQFQQIPNLIPAAEELANGQFVALASDNTFVKASSSVAATHLVLKSGEPRLTAQEVADFVGTVQTGEPVMAITGQGTVSIPVSTTIAKGEQLVVSNGYAAKRTMASVGWVIGYAMEDIDHLDVSEVAFIDCFVELPAKYHEANI